MQSPSKPIQGDLFDQMTAKVEPPKKSIAEGFAKIREAGYLDDKAIDKLLVKDSLTTEPVAKPEGQKKDPVGAGNFSIRLDSVIPDREILPPKQGKVNPYQIALGITVAGIGAFLEIYYYFFRFSMDGTPIPLAILSGVGLTGFLLVTYIKKIWWLYVPLVLFSVFATSAGQSYALSLDALQQGRNKAVTEETRKVITDLETEKNRLSGAIAGIVIPKSMDTRRKYGPEVERAMREKAGYEAELKAVQDRLDALRPAGVDPGTRETSYQFYARVFGWSAELVQILVHTVLSVFVALMAPVSLKKLVLEKVKND